MIRFAPAKINIGLYITGLRSDGYHTIESCLVPIPLYDILEVTAPDGLTADAFLLKGLPVKGDPSANSVLKVLHALRERRYAVPPLRIELIKQIPSEAGLGGGSSDAAALLRAVNDLLHLGIPKPELAEIAAVAGADTPFFIYNGPMLATGIGTDLEPLELLPELRDAYIAVVKPPIAVSTKEAYALTECNPAMKGILKTQWNSPLPLGDRGISNDFEAALFPRYPLLAELKQLLLRKGAFYASLSGSGSALYGLFKTPPTLTPSELPEACFLRQSPFVDRHHSIPL